MHTNISHVNTLYLRSQTTYKWSSAVNTKAVHNLHTTHSYSYITTLPMNTTYSDGMRIENPLIRISNLMYMNHLAINHRRLIRMALVHHVAG